MKSYLQEFCKLSMRIILFGYAEECWKLEISIAFGNKRNSYLYTLRLCKKLGKTHLRNIRKSSISVLMGTGSCGDTKGVILIRFGVHKSQEQSIFSRRYKLSVRENHHHKFTERTGRKISFLPLCLSTFMQILYFAVCTNKLYQTFLVHTSNIFIELVLLCVSIYIATTCWCCSLIFHSPAQLFPFRRTNFMVF